MSVAPGLAILGTGGDTLRISDASQRPSVSADISDAGPEDPPLGPSRKRAEYPSPPELLVGI